MKILNRYLLKEVLLNTAFVFLALLMLFAFFDLIHELGDLGKGSYRLGMILLFVLLSVPGHVYELFPIATLIGTMLALARLVAHSEFTVMRVSGVSARRMAFYLAQLGLVFMVATFVAGEFLAPASERAAEQLRLRSLKSVVAQEFRSGLWVKDENSFVNVREILPDTSLVGVRIYRFDQAHHLTDISLAKRGVYLGDGNWRLTDVDRTRFGQDHADVSHLAQIEWHSVLNPEILSVLLVVPEQMSIWNLYAYVQHLRENNQKTVRYEIALWSKLVYPFAAMVTMLLALPFAYQQTRAAGVSGKVLAGIMLGLGFHLTNRLFAYLGQIYNWSAVFSAVFPTLLFLVAAMVMMWRVERR